MVQEVNMVPNDGNDTAFPNYTHEKNTPWLRLVVAVVVQVCAFIYFLSYDMPGSLIGVLEETFNVDAAKFEYLYTFYGIPPTVLCLFGGVLVDKVFGLTRGSLYTVLIAITGQIVITIGGFTELFWVMVLGRFISGIGTEIFVVCLNCYIIIWFKNKEDTLVFGLFQLSLKIGSAFAFYFAVPLYKLIRNDNTIPHNIRLGLTLTPFMGFVIMQFFLVIILIRLTEMIEHKLPGNDENLNPSFHLTSIKLSLKIILFIAVGCVVTANIFGLVSCSQQLFQRKYDISVEEANKLCIFFNVFTAISSPFCGLIINNFVNKQVFCLLGVLVGIVSQVFFIANMISPYVPLALFAICGNMSAIIVLHVVGSSVESSMTGTAYGLLQCFSNAVTALIQFLMGCMLDNAAPDLIFVFIAVLLLLCLAACIWIIILDRKNSWSIDFDKI